MTRGEEMLELHVPPEEAAAFREQIEQTLVREVDTVKRTLDLALGGHIGKHHPPRYLQKMSEVRDLRDEVEDQPEGGTLDLEATRNALVSVLADGESRGEWWTQELLRVEVA